MARKREHWFFYLRRSRKKYFPAEATEALALRIENLAADFRTNESHATRHELRRIQTAVSRIEEALSSASGTCEQAMGPPDGADEPIGYLDH